MPFHRSKYAFPINRISTDQGPSSGSECLVRTAGTAAKSLQSCPTLCDPIESSPPGSPVLDSMLKSRDITMDVRVGP